MTPEEVTACLAVAQVQLMADGHAARDVHTATWRAVRYAERMSGHVRESVRPVVFEDLLRQQLAGCGPWISGVEAARERGDYRRGMERAARERLWAEGVERFTGDAVGPTMRGAWPDAFDEAERAW